MRIESALKTRDTMKVRVRDLYAMAKMSGYLSTELTDFYLSIVNGGPKGTPAWVTSYLDGYRQALNDDLFENHLVFGGWVAGVFYSVSSKRADYYGNHGIDPVDWSNDGFATDKGYYWNRTMPYRGGTYDRGGIKPYWV